MSLFVSAFPVHRVRGTSGAVAALGMLAMSLAACSTEGDLVVTEGVGISAVRTVCPSVGIPDYTGDITLFGAGGGEAASNMDLTATITNVRSTCNVSDEQIYSEATFDVLVSRTNVQGARSVNLPYFSVVLRGGTSVQSKRIGTVTVQFADGESRAQAQGRAGAYVNRAESTLPDDIRRKITRKRKPGDPDAALDPLSDPQVRDALKRATFELLIGFQLTEEQLVYNARR